MREYILQSARARWTRGCSTLALRRPSSELQKSSISLGRSRQIEYGVASSSALMSAMRAVGGIKSSTGATASEVKDAEKRDTLIMGNFLLEQSVQL